MNLKETFDNLIHKKTNPENLITKTPEVAEVETSPEEEISPERIEALQGFEAEVQEYAKLSESDLKEQFSTPEEKEALVEKINILVKIGEILKEHTPEIAIALVGLVSLVAAMNNSSDSLIQTAAVSAEKITGIAASAITAVAAVVSTVLWKYKNFSKQYEQSSN